MSVISILVLIALLLFFGLMTLCSAVQSRSLAGHRTLAKLSKGQLERRDFWSCFPFCQLINIASRLVFLDDAVAIKLKRDLEKADMSISPKEYTARRYLTVAGGAVLIALCGVLRFYFGILIAVLGTAFVLLKQRDEIGSRIRKTELAITQEMPRFTKTICRSLQSNRDLQSVIAAYRKIAGLELGAELDILLAEMRAGNVQLSLLHFQDRLGTPEASRLCGALRDMSMGIDQTATLAYIADDMTRQARENIKRELSLRPEKMRRTYYPAIGVCVAMILYILIIYVINNLNNIT